jgi:hypothetical protein
MTLKEISDELRALGGKISGGTIQPWDAESRLIELASANPGHLMPFCGIRCCGRCSCSGSTCGAAGSSIPGSAGATAGSSGAG